MNGIRDRISAFRHWCWVYQDHIAGYGYLVATLALIALVAFGASKGALWLARKNADARALAPADGPSPVTLYQTLKIIGY